MHNFFKKDSSITISDCLLQGLEKSIIFKCPQCLCPTSDDDYKINNKAFPIKINERIGSGLDGEYHDWTEIHKCQNCGCDFYYINGTI